MCQWFIFVYMDSGSGHVCLEGREDVWSKPDSTSELGAQVIFSFLIIAEARCVWKGAEDVWSW